MKKATIISIGLILLGFVFECLFLGTDQMFFVIKFWLLGVISIIAGVIGLIWFTILPLLETRAKTLGNFKRKSLAEKLKEKQSKKTGLISN